MSIIRTYSELRRLKTFEERFSYLRLNGSVGFKTFGFDRHMNQGLYHSKEWRDVRKEVAIRDEGCDLGIEGYEIHGSVLDHHMNPLLPSDIIEGSTDMLDPRFLITTTQKTHNAIHYGDETLLSVPHKARVRGDTKLW